MTTTLFLTDVLVAAGNGWISQISIMALGVFAAAYFLKGIQTGGFINILIIAIVLIVLNKTIGGILNFITTPLRWVTLGLMSLVVDALIIMLADKFLKGFRVDGFIPAFLMAIVISLVTMVVNWIF